MEERLTAVVYVNVLNEVMIPSVNAVYGQNLHFSKTMHRNTQQALCKTTSKKITSQFYLGLQIVPT